MTLTKLLAGFIGQHRRAYALAATMLGVIAILTVQVPRRVGAIIDGLIAHRLDRAGLIVELGWLLAIGIVIYFLRVGWRLQLFKAAYQFGVSLRTRLYRQLSQQGLGFYQTARTGNLMALATNDIDTIEMVAGEAMLAGFDGSLTLMLVVVFMFLCVDWRLALAALLPFPVMAYAFWRISQQVHAHSTVALDRFGELNDHVQETVTGVRSVRALGMEGRSGQQFAALVANCASADLASQRWQAAYEPAVGITLTAAASLTLALGGLLIWRGQLSVGALTTFSMYLGQLIWPMFAAGWVLSLFERARAAWERLAPILQAPPSVEDDGRIETPPAGAIDIADLAFTYTGRTVPALQGVSLRLTPGMTLGVVGPTGSGKSTLLRLMLRQYAPSHGTLCWNGHAFSAYRLAALRQATGWVPQEAFLFSTTIAENIALARPDASRAEIEAVARLAAIHDDILIWPHGYDTTVGERGITLSGGQRQRVALARALLADSALLLMDDALSAVDTVTENEILQHLRDQRGQGAGLSAQDARMLVIATHRLSAVVDADAIVVLRAGHVIATGTHASLLAQEGWYAAQWRYQQLEAGFDAA